jgi:hypothetical protein
VLGKAVHTTSERQKLALVKEAIRREDMPRARALTQSMLRENPRSVMAWSWACQVAATTEERIGCLRHILEIDPNHSGARRYLAQLRPPGTGQGAAPADDASLPPTPHARKPEPAGTEPRHRLADLLFAPLGCLLQIPMAYLIGILLAFTVIGAVLYYTANSDFLGLATLDFEGLTISNAYERIEARDRYWTITFEKKAESRFAGLVRHVLPIRSARVPFLTHDILVTVGDYADPDVVRTSVFNHRFHWRSATTAHPQGTINLLHTVPADERIYRQLLDIQRWAQVMITGREIDQIKMYDQADTYRGDWHDTG